jgi:hypothetical protein
METYFKFAYVLWILIYIYTQHDGKQHFNFVPCRVFFASPMGDQTKPLMSYNYAVLKCKEVFAGGQ